MIGSVVIPPVRWVEGLGTGSAGWLGTTRLPDIGSAVVRLVALPAVGQSQERLTLEDAPCALEHALLAGGEALVSGSCLEPVRYESDLDELAALKEVDVLLVAPRNLSRPLRQKLRISSVDRCGWSGC
jgi:hypothetical protein